MASHFTILSKVTRLICFLFGILAIYTENIYIRYNYTKRTQNCTDKRRIDLSDKKNNQIFDNAQDDSSNISQEFSAIEK